MKDLLRECGRKAFHMLILAYLAAYHLLGYPRVIAWMLVWAAAVVAIETARLRLPRLNRALTAPFAGMARDEEYRHYSGIVHTTFGALIVMAAFGSRPKIVAASLLFLALGDAAAALAGKTLGRHRIFGGKKSFEGSLACFIVCAAVGGALGFAPLAAAGAAAAATAIEMAPTTSFFNDNLWMPVASAAVLRFLT